jgi:hypothetical protein
MKPSIVIIVALLATISINSYGQCEALVQQCIEKNNVSSSSLGGSVQQSLLLNDTIKIPIVFTAGTSYRVSMCSTNKTHAMRYRVTDENNNSLLNGALDQSGYSYNRFTALSDANGTIEATLGAVTIEPVCAALIIGFEK